MANTEAASFLTDKVRELCPSPEKAGKQCGKEFLDTLPLKLEHQIPTNIKEAVEIKVGPEVQDEPNVSLPTQDDKTQQSGQQSSTLPLESVIKDPVEKGWSSIGEDTSYYLD